MGFQACWQGVSREKPGCRLLRLLVFTISVAEVYRRMSSLKGPDWIFFFFFFFFALNSSLKPGGGRPRREPRYRQGCILGGGCPGRWTHREVRAIFHTEPAFAIIA